MSNLMINWDLVQTSRLIPAGYYNMKIVKAELVNNSYDGCKQINLEMRVEMENNPSHGKAYHEFLKLGQVGRKIAEGPNTTPEFIERMAIDDPEFEDPIVRAHSHELKTFKRIVEAGGMTLQGESSLAEVVAKAVGLQFTAQINVGVHKFGKRAGEEKNFIGPEDSAAKTSQGIFAYGTRLGNESTVKSSVPKPVRPFTSAVRPKPIMTAPIAAPVAFFDDEEE
jgi:hypothetical protein